MTLFSAQPSVLLIFSLLALLAGPLLFYFAKFNENILKGLDGFVLVLICGLVFLHIVPHTVVEIGWAAFVIIAASLLLPTFIERMQMRVAKTAHTLTLVLAMLGITLHSFTDGMALLNPSADHIHGNMLPMVVILHRIPDGLTIWWLLRPLYGNWAAIRTLSVMAIATVLGYFVGEVVFANISSYGVGVFEAIVGGSLMHVIFHHAHPMQQEKSKPGNQWASGFGAIAAIALILFALRAESTEPDSYSQSAFAVLKTLSLQSAPALLIAYFFAGIVQTFMPRAAAAWLKKGGAAKQSLKGMTFGLPLSICSCGVVPVYRSLILQGAPIAAAIAFFVATPELSLDAFLLSIPLLGARYTALRIASAFLIAFIMGIVIHRVAKRFPVNTPREAEVTTNPNAHLNFPQKIARAIKVGYVDSIDDTGPWIVLGIVLAAFLEPFLKSSLDGVSLSGFWEVPLFALIGMPLYVCASGATPLVAVLIHSGISPGAGLAFLLTGPATNATTFGVLSKFHGRKVAIGFVIGMITLSVSFGWILNLVFDTATLPPLFSSDHQHFAPFQNLSLIVLLSLFIFSLLRRGPRKIINSIVAFENDSSDSEAASCCSTKKDNHKGHNHSHSHGMGRVKKVEPKKSCCEH